MKVLVTGSDGYLGSLLVARLVADQHEVTGVDTGFYRDGWLYRGTTAVPTIVQDIRKLTVGDLGGVDAVVHMAELSNDPVGELSPEITDAINHRGSVRLAQMAKAAGVPRFVYMSSCSVYGVATDGDVVETSPVNPRTAYARCKVLVERDLSAMADERFSPIVLRNATAFGASPYMRFDLVVNNLAGLAWTTGSITLTSDGMPWRPLVHGCDIAKAVTCVLDAPREAVHNEVFNVGDASQNYRIVDIAEAVGKVMDVGTIRRGAASPDDRSYRVSFDKIRERLPAFRCEWDVVRGATQLRDLFSGMMLDAATFDFRAFTRVKQIKYLLESGLIDCDFFWARRR